MKKILVTGASGFLGSRIAISFKEKYKVFAPTHKEMDITDEKSVEKAFISYMPDVIIHCAAISDVGLCEKEQELSWDINVNGCVNVARVAGKIGAKCIICSSDQIYFGSKVQGAHCEEEVLTPFNLYGREKLKAEQLCLTENPDCVLLRLSWMYDTKNVNDKEHSDFMRMLLPKIDTNESLCYAVNDIRGISNVNEVIQNIEKAFEIVGGVYNFGSPNDKNMYDTMYEVFLRLNLNVNQLQKNELVFQNNPRNMSMCQKKINSCGIVFSDTVENLVKTLDRVRNGLS